MSVITHTELAAVTGVSGCAKTRELAARHVTSRCQARAVASADVAVSARQRSLRHGAILAKVRLKLNRWLLTCLSWGCLRSFNFFGAHCLFLSLKLLRLWSFDSLWSFHFDRLCVVINFSRSTLCWFQRTWFFLRSSLIFVSWVVTVNWRVVTNRRTVSHRWTVSYWWTMLHLRTVSDWGAVSNWDSRSPYEICKFFVPNVIITVLVNPSDDANNLMFQKVSPLSSAERSKVIDFNRTRSANINCVKRSRNTEVALGGKCLSVKLKIS